MLSFEATTREIELATGRIHYNEAGDGPVLFGFHGGGPGANAWDNTKWNIEALSQHFRVILMDLPGYGGSAHVEALQDEAPEAMHARVIETFMDRLGIERAHFYGTSMSTGPVMYFAYTRPTRVLKLVLKTPATGPNILTPTPPDGIMALNDFNATPTRENMERIMRLFIPKPGLVTPQMVDARFASAMTARAMPRPQRTPSGVVDIRQILAGLNVPVFVLWGHQDRMVPLDGALTALALIPDVQIHLWGGGTGHFIEFEHTEDFNRLVSDFLLK